MSDVTESVDVNVPISTAYNQWTQFESFPQFMDGVESVRQTDDSHSHWVTKVGGVRREFDTEITEQHPDERIAWKSVGGDTSHAGVVTFHRLGDSDTRVTVQLAWQPQGLVERAGSVVGMDRHQVKADTARFKTFIEQRGAATGQWRGDKPAPAAQNPGASGLAAHTPGAVGTAVRTHTPGGVAPAVEPPVIASGQGDIVDVLLAQHEQIKEGFARVQAASGAAKEQLFGALADLLHTHEVGEQQVVRPVTRESGLDGQQVATARVQEETKADQALAGLKTLSIGDPQFDARFEAFHQAVLAHAAREEQEEFPLLRRLTVERRRVMADELRATQGAQLGTQAE